MNDKNFNFEDWWTETLRQCAVAAIDEDHALPTFNIVETNAVTGQRIPNTPTYQMRGLCGFAWVSIRPARGKLVSWLKSKNLGHTDSYAGGFKIWIGSNFPGGSTQSVDVKEAIAGVVAKRINELGVKAYVGSRLD